MSTDTKNQRLAGQVALITGATSGIGYATALLFAKEGARVVAIGRSVDRLAKLNAAMPSGSQPLVPLVVDIRQREQVYTSVETALGSCGRIDILVNSAGIGAYRPFVEWTDDQFADLMSINVMGTWLYCKAVIPRMLAQGAGTVVNVSSVAGLKGYETETAYCASKFAQVGLSQALDREFHRKNIRVCVVCPGAVATEFAMGAGRSPGDPGLEQYSTAEEVADAILLAAQPSPKSRILQIVMRPMPEVG